MSAATEAILDAIIPLAPVENLRILVGMIEDRIGGDAGLDKINEAVTFAKANWSPFFHKEKASPTPPTTEATTTAQPVATPAQQRRQAHQADALDAAIARCGGNPYTTNNRTVIALVEHRDPARASKLKAEAGK